MSTIRVGDENFRSLYKENEYVILDFWAPWCGPCDQFSPIFEEVSQQHTDLVFGKVNTEEESKLSGYFGIRSIPTLIIIREQIEIFRHSGFINQKDLETLIKNIKGTPMEKIIKELGIEGLDSEEQ